MNGSDGTATRFPACAEALEPRRLLSAGDLDLTFSDDGRRTLDLGSLVGVRDVAVQSDGKIIVAGRARDIVRAPDDALLVRLNADGTTDTSFGANGVVRIDFPGDAWFDTVILLPDGKIFAGGNADDGWVLARFSAGGQPDTSFGTGGFQFGEGHISDIVLLSTGQFVSVGSGIVRRHNAAGSLDSTFGTGGTGEVDLAPAFPNLVNVNSIALDIDPLNRVVVSGSAFVRQFDDDGDGEPELGIQDVAIWRLSAGGTIDNSFDRDGLVLLDRDEFERGVDIVAAPDGTVLVLNAKEEGDNSLFRLLDNGALDRTFGNGPGFVEVDFAHRQHYLDTNGAIELAVAPDGSIYISGQSGSHEDETGNVDFAIQRRNADGGIDETFGNNGTRLVDFPEPGSDPLRAERDLAPALALAPGGNIVLAGVSQVDIGGRTQIAVARLQGDAGDPSGVLVGRGTGGDDTITIRRTGIDDVIVQINGTSQTFDMDNFRGGVRLEGLGGNDHITVIDSLLLPVTRRVTLDGGAGNDRLTGNDGPDLILGRAGNDSLVGSYGDDTLDGGGGSDIGDGGPGNDTLVTIELQPGPGSIGRVGRTLIADGSWGQDLITIERTGLDDVIVRVNETSRTFDMDDFDAVLLRGNNGFDELRVIHPLVSGSLVRPITLQGGNGADTLTGSDGASVEVLDGGEGNDFLDTRDLFGGDWAIGGNGNDRAVVDPGDTTRGTESFA